MTNVSSIAEFRKSKMPEPVPVPAEKKPRSRKTRGIVTIRMGGPYATRYVNGKSETVIDMALIRPPNQ